MALVLLIFSFEQCWLKFFYDFVGNLVDFLILDCHLNLHKVCGVFFSFLFIPSYLFLSNRCVTLLHTYTLNRSVYINLTIQVDPTVCGHNGHFQTSCGNTFSKCLTSNRAGQACEGKGMGSAFVP